MAEALRRIPRAGHRAQRLLLPASALLLIVTLLVAPAAYWTGVNSISPYSNPPRTLPVPNGYQRARAALLKAPQGLLLPSPNWRELTPRILAERVKKLQPALDAVKSQFSIPWAVPDETGLRQRTPFDYCATWYAIRSRLAREDGDPTRALEYAVDAMELGGNACRNGWITDRYAGQSCQFSGLEAAERVFPRLRREGLLAQIERVRRIRAAWPTITETLENERVTNLRACTAHLQEVERHSLWEQLAAAERGGYQSYSSFASPTPGWPPHLYAWPVWQQVLTPHSAARADLERYYQELISASGRPAPNGVPHTDPTNPWVKQFAASSFIGQYRGEWPRNNLAILETALAVRLFYLTNGRYPRRLQEIPRLWLPEIPMDVWNQPVAYRLKGARALIYSWGPDQRDDGGRPVKPASVLSGSKGDLVFGKLCDEDWPKPPMHVAAY